MIIKNIYKKTSIVTAFLLTMFVSSSCEDFLDVNTDPNVPATASEFQLLPSAQVGYTYAFSNFYERGPATLVQQVMNGRWNYYDINGNIDNEWDFDLYGGALADFELLIDQATEKGNLHYAAIAKLQKAYIFSILVDMHGEVPYFEALKADEGVFNASLDDGAAIYDDLFNLIDEALGQLEQPAADGELMPASDDLIYNGNIEKWIKMGNTLKLKMLNQIRLVDAGKATAGINQIISQGNFITENADNFVFKFGTSTAPENRHPHFQAEYAASSKESYMSLFFHTLLTSKSDPRLKYYYYNQIATPAVLVKPAQDGGLGGATDNTRTTYGIYPIGGKFDDGSTGVTRATSGLQGAGVAPYMTASMSHFILAEAAATLNTTGDAKEYMEVGIRLSMDYVGSVSNKPIAEEEVEAYITSVSANFNSNKVETIMNQKYIALFGMGYESYTDYRRTGFPVLSEAEAPNGPYPIRIPISSNEIISNPNISSDVIDVTKPVFWDR